MAIVLMALLVLTAVASGALVAASGQRRAAQVAGQSVAGRTLARGTVNRALVELGGWASAGVGDTAEVVAEGTAGVSNVWRLRSMRISPEYHLVVAEAGPEGGFQVREARLVWWLDPLTRVAGHAAVVEADSAPCGRGGQSGGGFAARGARGTPQLRQRPGRIRRARRDRTRYRCAPLHRPSGEPTTRTVTSRA